MSTKRMRPNGRWEFRIRSRLLPRPVYLSFDDEAEGDAYVRRIEQLLARGVVPPELQVAREDAQPRLRAAMLDYLRAQPVSAADAAVLRVLLDRLPPTLELRALTFRWATEWVSSMKRVDNLSPDTIRHKVGALARCLDWVVASGDVPINPLRQLPRGYAQYTAEDGRILAETGGGAVKRAQERDRRLAAGEEDRIRSVLSGAKPAGRQRPLELREGAALLALFDVALETAMRLSEIYTLAVDQIDLPKRTVFLDKTKNGDKRQVPLSTVAVKVLKARIGGRRDGLVFPWWNGDRDPLVLRRVTSLLSRQFGRVFDAAGCPDLRFHDLRHEATSRLFERTTLSDLQIAKITGHKDIRMLSRYANLRGSDLAARLW